MHQVDIKQFLRKWGFRHTRDIDRGSVWTNGLDDLTVLKSYDRIPGELRTLQEEVRSSARRKEQENQRRKQMESRVHAPTHEPHGGVAGVTTINLKARKRTRGYRKYKREEKLHVFGRIKHLLLNEKLNTKEIAHALNAEGITLANGDPMTATYVGQVLWKWQRKPEYMQRLATVMLPRRRPEKLSPVGPVETVVVTALPVETTPTPPIEPTKDFDKIHENLFDGGVKPLVEKPGTWGLLRSVLRSKVRAEDKVEILLGWLEQ